MKVNNVGKEENAVYQHFLFFLFCFQKPFLGGVKNRDCAVKRDAGGNVLCLVADCRPVVHRTALKKVRGLFIYLFKKSNIIELIALGECNTILSAYTKYRHLE